MVRWVKKGSVDMCGMLSKASPAASFKHILALYNNFSVKYWERMNLTRKAVEMVKEFAEPIES